MRFPYLSVNAGVITKTPPDAPRSPRSSGRRTIPTIRSGIRGPAGAAFCAHPTLKQISICFGVNDLVVEIVANTEMKLGRQPFSDRYLVGRGDVDRATRDDARSIYDRSETRIERFSDGRQLRDGRNL